VERSDSPRPGRSVMAGDGLYNEHSQPQHVAGGDGVPLLVRASEAISPDRKRGIVVADYGSSQGRNSLVPMSVVIEKLRDRLGADAPISIFHTDLPSNDFTALFTTLEADPQSYLNGANVFAYAAGRSFYERLFPAEHVALGWSSIAVHWLSSVPAPLREHIFSPLGTAPARRQTSPTRCGRATGKATTSPSMRRASRTSCVRSPSRRCSAGLRPSAPRRSPQRSRTSSTGGCAKRSLSSRRRVSAPGGSCCCGLPSGGRQWHRRAARTAAPSSGRGRPTAALHLRIGERAGK
jgi:hypothetical protein